jgi:hypothetical protein
VKASSAFTIENLLPRLARERNDPWKTALEPKQRLPRKAPGLPEKR